MTRVSLNGSRRKLNSLIQPIEQMVLSRVVRRVPSWMQTSHLTLLTVLWSVAAVLVGYLGRSSVWWLLLMSVLIFVQYVTDILDGAVGRYRNTGLVRWGFYMDHFFDYVFACAVVSGYALALQVSREFLLVALFVCAGIFIHELLLCSIRGQFNTSGYYGFGPTELRFIVMIANILLVVALPRFYLTRLVETLLPVSFVLFILLVYRAHRHLWQMDMEYKKRSSGEAKKD